MKIETVRENLTHTIAGKESLLKKLRQKGGTEAIAADFLAINIEELKCILKDVEECCQPQTKFEL